MTINILDSEEGVRGSKFVVRFRTNKFVLGHDNLVAFRGGRIKHNRIRIRLDNTALVLFAARVWVHLFKPLHL